MFKQVNVGTRVLFALLYAFHIYRVKNRKKENYSHSRYSEVRNWIGRRLRQETSQKCRCLLTENVSKVERERKLKTVYVQNAQLKKSNEMQQYAYIYLLLNYSTYFGRPSRPSSGVHKTVVAPSGTDHTIWGASFLKHDLIWSHLVCILLHLIEFLQRK